jgi:hypothetical protein
MKAFWDKRYGTDALCGITHARLRPGCNSKGESYCVFLKCGHGFYRKPVTVWLSQQHTCPMCRIDVECDKVQTDVYDWLESEMHF